MPTWESAAMIETVRSILRVKGNQIWSLGPDATVFEAISLMAEKRIGALLVLAGDRLEGIISERDYARKVILLGHSSKDTLVRQIMTPHVVTVTPEHTVVDCMRLITSHRIRHLPVIEQERPVGIVSIGDVVNSIIHTQAETIQHLNNYIKGGYPA